MQFDPNILIPEIDEALRNGFKKSSDEDLERFITGMCILTINNCRVRERYLMRGITINHVQAARRIQRLHDDNANTQRLVIILAIIAILVGGLQVIVGILGACR